MLYSENSLRKKLSPVQPNGSSLLLYKWERKTTKMMLRKHGILEKWRGNGAPTLAPTFCYHFVKDETRFRMILVRDQQFFSYNEADGTCCRLYRTHSLDCNLSALL